MIDLLLRTESRRQKALDHLDGRVRVDFGQYFTPYRAAALIAEMARLPQRGHIRVLDPGAGVGSLSAALINRVLDQRADLSVDLTAVEIDHAVVPYLEETLADCTDIATKRGIELTSHVIVGDYVEMSTSLWMKEPGLADPFDLVVMNPPYQKLGASSSHRRALSAHGVDCPNLYAAFLALGVNALRPGGQVVAITPRSFANGAYFADFRRFLLGRVAFDRLHVFESRSTVFSDSGVLQENVILAATRDAKPASVVLSASFSDHDRPVERIVPYDQVVHPGDEDQYIRVLVDDDDTRVGGLVGGLPSTIGSLGLEVSTGKVVDFRLKPYLRDEPENGCVPLIYPANLRGGVIEWPRAIRKPQGFAAIDEVSLKQLMPAGCYVVVKRFSSKEERRRVVAAVWDPERNGTPPIAFENHLNVIHRVGEGLDRDLAVGLSLWLNSGLVDRYFRTFSGHTQVNAGDLRSMRFPPETSLRSLGAGQPVDLPEQQKIDSLVEEIVDGIKVGM